MILGCHVGNRVERHRTKGVSRGWGWGCKENVGLEGGSWEGVPRGPRFLACTAGPMVETFMEIGTLVAVGGDVKRDEVFVGYPGGDDKDVRIFVVTTR